ncbi:hypothetical protein SMICM304S_02334 [Streptomyces microflavus]
MVGGDPGGVPEETGGRRVRGTAPGPPGRRRQFQGHFVVRPVATASRCRARQSGSSAASASARCTAIRRASTEDAWYVAEAISGCRNVTVPSMACIRPVRSASSGCAEVHAQQLRRPQQQGQIAPPLGRRDQHHQPGAFRQFADL